ncbi:hypothetical protein [Tepidibacillus decaturensis]|uniref:Prepilin-type N-terminal cleavage/methylation domain-containing protein n=1 Tax=Tepidibacillus decaturensis TaxID=1413211 RepID=A0A135L2W7_9BACI|nr:hypothetical protein [Tepidibacillus decaturensis]KXG43249.1 hypothetical protein U473_03885 [Tepidibacillus decaturensis]
MWNHKGAILIETLVSIFIISVILMSYIPIYSQVVKEKEQRKMYDQAIILARKEMEETQLTLVSSTKQIDSYLVEVKVSSYLENILELKVTVKWEELGLGKQRQVVLRKLIYSPT